MPPADTGVVLPLRSFTHGKARIAEQLGAARREQFVRTMADRVANAAGSLPVVVVSSAPEVVVWAQARGHLVLPDPGSLDGAATAGRDHFRDQGYVRVVIAHGDLPFARTLGHVAGDGAAQVAVVVPCHRDDGTPVLAIPTDVPFAFAYGHGSFARHCEHARALGLDVRVVRDRDLSFDVDVPDDLARVEIEHATGAGKHAPCP
jgi:2-phospho-L-lactate/phosphoenolpyruvate guanylyltransferase